MRRIVLLIAALFATLGWAKAEDLQVGLAYESIAVTSSFVGDEVVLFGSIENGDLEALTRGQYDVVVTIVGPAKEAVVRRKERTFGIWINGAAQRFIRVPSFLSLASNRPLEEIAPPALIDKLQLGYAHLSLKPQDPGSDVAEFRTALTRLKHREGLARESIAGIRFISKTLFRARLPVPANVPIGRHTVRAYLFKGGDLLVKKSARLSVRKKGFEQFTYNLAHRHSLLYGILAVLIAIATGWLASVVFRKD